MNFRALYRFLLASAAAPLALSLFIGAVYATDYYVDARAGSDDSDGKSPATAWRSLERVSDASELQPGDVVRFKKGETWRGRLKPRSGAPDAPITYASYGEGAKPSFLGSTSLANESFWVKVGEDLWTTRRANVRKLADVDGSDPKAFLGTQNWSFYQESGADVLYSVSTDEEGGYVYKFHFDDGGTAANRVQWFASGFSVRKGECYRVSFDMQASQEFSFIAALMKSSAPWSSYGVTVFGGTTPAPKPTRGVVVFRATQDADDARVTFYLGGAPANVDLTFSNFKVERVEIDALELAPDVGNIIIDGERAAFKRWTIDDLKNEDDFCYERTEGRVWYRSKENPARGKKSLEAAVMKHIIDHANVTDAIFDGLDLRYGGAHGFGGSRAERVVIRNCDISWIGGGDQYREGGDGRRVRFGNGVEFWADARDVLVENCRLWEVYDAALTNQGSGKNVESNITYRNNLIWNCEYSFEYWNRDAESVTENVLFENNVCLNAGYGWGHEQRPDKNGRCLMFYSNTAQTKNFVVRNNVFANATESLVRSDVDWTPEAPVLDQNVYYQDDPNRAYFFWKKNSYFLDDFSTFQSETNQEAQGKSERVDVDAILRERAEE